MMIELVGEILQKLFAAGGPDAAQGIVAAERTLAKQMLEASLDALGDEERRDGRQSTHKELAEIRRLELVLEDADVVGFATGLKLLQPGKVVRGLAPEEII
jgi:hypothetical protein